MVSYVELIAYKEDFIFEVFKFKPLGKQKPIIDYKKYGVVVMPDGGYVKVKGLKYYVTRKRESKIINKLLWFKGYLKDFNANLKVKINGKIIFDTKRFKDKEQAFKELINKLKEEEVI